MCICECAFEVKVKGQGCDYHPNGHGVVSVWWCCGKYFGNAETLTSAVGMVHLECLNRLPAVCRSIAYSFISRVDSSLHQVHHLLCAYLNESINRTILPQICSASPGADTIFPTNLGIIISNQTAPCSRIRSLFPTTPTQIVSGSCAGLTKSMHARFISELKSVCLIYCYTIACNRTQIVHYYHKIMAILCINILFDSLWTLILSWGF